jgi:hypothetical protein
MKTTFFVSRIVLSRLVGEGLQLELWLIYNVLRCGVFCLTISEQSSFGSWWGVTYSSVYESTEDSLQTWVSFTVFIYCRLKDKLWTFIWNCSFGWDFMYLPLHLPLNHQHDKLIRLFRLGYSIVLWARRTILFASWHIVESFQTSCWNSIWNFVQTVSN